MSISLYDFIEDHFTDEELPKRSFNHDNHTGDSPSLHGVLPSERDLLATLGKIWRNRNHLSTSDREQLENLSE